MLSTHIMQEVEAICSKVIILSKGKIVANENQEYLKLHTGREGATTYIEFLEDTKPEIFTGIEGLSQVERVGKTGWLIFTSGTVDPRADLFKLAVKNGLTVITLQAQEKHLEDVFRELTSGN